MLILALDTTTRAGSVAVVRDTTVLAVVRGDASRTHGERLPGELDRALVQASVTQRDVELLAVTSGPGAFTGLRIGLAAMQGLAMVWNVPVIGVSALDALALSAATARGTVPPPGTVPERGDSPPGRNFDIAAWMDAQRGEVFAAFYENQPSVANSEEGTVPAPGTVPGSGSVPGLGRLTGLVVPSASIPPTVGTPEAVLASIPSARDVLFIGDGATRYRVEILAAGNGRYRIDDATPELAPFVAAIGVARAHRGEAGPPHALQPLYVRRPDAELERQRREAR